MKKIVWIVTILWTLFVLWANSVSALSFVQGTKFLDATTRVECEELGGNFTEWYGEIYCTTSGVYPDAETFLKAEWNTCSVATDWCNTVQVRNGQLGAMTMMYCEDIYGQNGQEAWSCLDDTLEREELWFLSDNDQNYYKLLRDETLNQENVDRINIILSDFSDKVLQIYNYDIEKSLEVIERAVARFENEIFNLVMTYPADVAMNQSDTQKYSVLHYAKFELMIISERWKRNSSM